MIQIVADAEARLLKPGARIIPTFVATLAVPVGPPKLTFANTFVNFIYPATEIFVPRVPGVYNSYGPSLYMEQLSDDKLEIETYYFGDEPRAKPAAKQMLTT